MRVEINSCNNVSNVSIDIPENETTILFGPNGVGKSTIAHAIAAQCDGAYELEEMIPYGSTNQPSVTGIAPETRVLVFDEDYIQKSLFQDDSHLVVDGIRMFIETPEYRSALDHTKELIDNAIKGFNSDDNLTELLSDLDSLIKCYGNAREGYAKSSSIAKSTIPNGDVITNIPSNLARFETLIRAEGSAGWITWHLKGKDYSSSSICPYCGKPFDGDYESCLQLDITYGNKLLEHTLAVAESFAKMSPIFSETANARVDEILHSQIGATPEQQNDLGRIKDDASTLRGKIVAIKSLSFGTLQNLDDIETYLRNAEIDIELLETLQSDIVRKRVEMLSNVLEDMIGKINEIKAAVGQQTTALRKAIQRSQKDIDSFFANAGFPYSLSIESSDGTTCSVILRSRTGNVAVSSPKKRLSYGERNALAIALFAVQVRQIHPSLVILDDPISSFDANKKYAIIHRLFAKGAGACSGVTTLLLTHDPEVLLMIEKIHKSRLCKTRSYCIITGRDMTEVIPIQGSDLKSAVSNLETLVKQDSCIASRIAHARRLIEITEGKDATWSLLSSLIHRKQIPGVTQNDTLIPLSTEEIAASEERLVELGIADFSYDGYLELLTDEKLLEAYDRSFEPYQKLSIFRMLSLSSSEMKQAKDSSGIGDSVFEFANEYFHIENIMLFQLDEQKCSMIPDYLIEQCDVLVDCFRSIVKQP